MMIMMIMMMMMIQFGAFQYLIIKVKSRQPSGQTTETPQTAYAK